MKVLNFDSRTLIFQNLRPIEKEQIPDRYTPCQYRILCSIIRRRHIKKEFFYLLLSELYGLEDWHRLSYSQMYKLVFVLSRYDFKKTEED